MPSGLFPRSSFTFTSIMRLCASAPAPIGFTSYLRSLSSANTSRQRASLPLGHLNELAVNIILGIANGRIIVDAIKPLTAAAAEGH